MAPISSDVVVRFAFWLPCACVVLHVFEEFVWPGGILAWDRIYRHELAESITPRFAVIGNLVLIAATVVLGVMGQSWSRSLSLWFVLAGLLAGNAVWHIHGALHTHRYSPGVVTGAILYLPLLVGGLWYFLSIRGAPLEIVVVGCVIGATYQFWSNFLHRRLLPGER
ncbi:MAG: HXXEE domain-containing protein [Rhodanobacteraceae bacterium]|nr:MAG: HXXEE domain-containing protein [Rhodanobacteraceae bacterium]